MCSTDCDGAELHRTLGAELWCVTKRDMIQLRQQIQKAIRAGEITPTEHDIFDPADFVNGPSLYTVNEQFIKPRTASAGNMSWSLMRNPKGLKCNLFITHAWQEGIFELLDKVISSWPRCYGVKHAWCCILANPQNLNISDLIRDPTSSPFAVALESAKYVLVVPNRFASVYTRLWCSYEAYLAYQWNKVILTASRPAFPRFIQALPIALFCVVLGGFLGTVWQPERVGWISEILGFGGHLLILIIMLSDSGWVHYICNLVGLLTSGWLLGVLHQFWHDSKQFGFTDGHGHSSGSADLMDAWSMWRNISFMNTAAFALFFIVSDYDRISHEMSCQESENLKYRGSIVNARCSDPDDASKIRAEIGESEGHVDRAVQTLICAGMSSRELREAEDAGIDIKHFSGHNLAFWAFAVVRNLEVQLAIRQSSLQALHWAGIVMTVLLVLTYLRNREDGRVFCGLALSKFEISIDLPAHAVSRICWKLGHISVMDMLEIQGWVGCLILGCIIALNILGIHRIVKVPCGRFIAQVIVAREFGQLRCPPKRKEPTRTSPHVSLGRPDLTHVVVDV